MTQQKIKRMLGNVELAIHGSSAHRPELTKALKAAIARNSALDGTLIIGYPQNTDALIVTPQGAVIAVVLHENPGEDSCARQDLAYNAVYSKLQKSEKLRQGRELTVTIQTLGIHSGIKEPRPDDPEHPLVNISQAAGKLEEIASAPCRRSDPEEVLAALLDMGRAAV